jgi:hypothetical protein
MSIAMECTREKKIGERTWSLIERLMGAPGAQVGTPVTDD